MQFGEIFYEPFFRRFGGSNNIIRQGRSKPRKQRGIPFVIRFKLDLVLPVRARAKHGATSFYYEVESEFRSSLRFGCKRIVFNEDFLHDVNFILNRMVHNNRQVGSCSYRYSIPVPRIYSWSIHSYLVGCDCSAPVFQIGETPIMRVPISPTEP